jgi:hypothetical protein
MEKGGGEEKAKHLCTAREELRICSGRGICSEGPFAHLQSIAIKIHNLLSNDISSLLTVMFIWLEYQLTTFLAREEVMPTDPNRWFLCN